MVYAEDLSTLAAERYISGFLIDACLTYSEEPMRKNFHSLYLPSFTQTWGLTKNVQFLQTKLKPYLSRIDLGDVVWILTPIHVNGNHWGLLCLNMAQQQAFYDDGLKQSPPTNIIELAEGCIRKPMEYCLSNSAVWNAQQPIFGEGCASCGITVILVVFDFIDNPADNGMPHFHWSFHDMESHRQRLLYRFTQRNK